MTDWYPPPPRPRPVEGGLKARSQRGAIGQQWWSARFTEVLEDIGMGNRLQRGRSYARKGQVISMAVGPGSVTAQVQGSRPRPYRVRIGIAAFGKAEWAQAERALAGNAWYTATLLTGEMPEDIEDVFAEIGLSLFPETARELSLDCTCPDQAVPCKHLAATFYLLAESFDEDPFAILAWRGREREDLPANLRAARSDGPPAADRAESPGRPLARLPRHLLRAPSRDEDRPPAGDPARGPSRPAAGSHRRGARQTADRTTATRLPRTRPRRRPRVTVATLRGRDVQRRGRRATRSSTPSSRPPRGHHLCTPNPGTGAVSDRGDLQDEGLGAGERHRCGAQQVGTRPRGSRSGQVKTRRR